MFSSTLLSVALLTGAPPVDPELHKKAEQLVAQLGDKDYRDRERAARDLLEMGYAAKDAVLAGQKNPDGEISDRCKKLYPAIFRHDLDKRVQKFLDNRDGPIPDDLPGARNWLKIAGDGKESRELYGEMVKGHPELLLQVELHPETLRQAYIDFMRDVFGRTNSRPVSGTGRLMPMDSEVLTYFFLGAVGDTRPTAAMAGVSSTYYYQFLNATFTSTKLTSSEPFRKLYAGWLEKERYTLVMRRGLDIAAQHGVKECAPAALRIASDKTITPIYRSTALLGFARLGNKDNLKDLEPFLKDATQVSAAVVVNGERGSVQLRDVALGAAVQAAGLSLSDFGFERKAPSGIASISSYTYFAFGTDEKRDAAHAKWKDWADKNLKK